MSSEQEKPSAKAILISTEKQKKMQQSVLEDPNPDHGEELKSSDRGSSIRPANAPTGDEHHNLSLVSPEVRSVSSTPATRTGTKTRRFAEVALEMVNYLSKEEPDLIGWADDDQHFYVNNHTNLDRVSRAMKLFFDHGNFASFRRQLSAYQFTREPGGKYRGYWYHSRFHRLSSEQDIHDIQSSRRRRVQGGSSSSKTRKPTDRSRRIKIRKPTPTPSVNSFKNAEVESGLIVFPESECSHLLDLDSVASLFPLASLARDEILNGGFAANEKDVTPNSMLNFDRGMEIEMVQVRPLSSFITCTPIKPNNIVAPLRSVFSPQIRQGTATGLVEYCDRFGENKENSKDHVTPSRFATDQNSPTTPVSQLSMFRRSSPFGYEGGLNQLLCSPYRQRPGVILAETRKPILFSFRTDLTSPGALQSKKPPPHQSDSNRGSESDSKPSSCKP